MSLIYQILTVLVTALGTFLTRFFPFGLFGRKGEPPECIKYIGKVLPPAVIAVLIIYCLKNINFSVSTNFLPQLLGVLVVIVLHLWKKNNLVSIGGGTISYMLMLQLFFK